MIGSPEASFVFFYGVFWATLLAGLPGYQLFSTREGVGSRRRFWRWVIGVSTLNILPALWLVLLITQVRAFVPETPELAPWVVVATVVASMSVFGFRWVLQTFVKAAERRLYEFDPQTDDPVDGPAGHGAPGDIRVPLAIGAALVYLLGWPLAGLGVVALAGDEGASPQGDPLAAIEQTLAEHARQLDRVEETLVSLDSFVRAAAAEPATSPGDDAIAIARLSCGDRVRSYRLSPCGDWTPESF